MNIGNNRAALRELASSEGVFTTAQAERFGIPRSALSYAYATGALERVVHGAYRLVGSQASFLDEVAALWKLTAPDKMSHERIPTSRWDGIAIGGATAASILGIGDFYLSPYRIYAPTRINSRRASACYGVRRIDRGDVSFFEGIPVTKAERTVFDLVLDKEDPSLVADALRDAMAGPFDVGRLKSLLVERFGTEKGKNVLARLLADAGFGTKG